MNLFDSLILIRKPSFELSKDTRFIAISHAERPKAC